MVARKKSPVPRKKTPVTRKFGSRVRKHRLELDWSQEQLAEASGLHWTYIGQVERGERNLSLNNIVRLGTALGVDPGELVSGLKSS